MCAYFFRCINKKRARAKDNDILWVYTIRWNFNVDDDHLGGFFVKLLHQNYTVVSLVDFCFCFSVKKKYYIHLKISSKLVIKNYDSNTNKPFIWWIFFSLPFNIFIHFTLYSFASILCLMFKEKKNTDAFYSYLSSLQRFFLSARRAVFFLHRIAFLVPCHFDQKVLDIIKSNNIINLIPASIYFIWL